MAGLYGRRWYAEHGETPDAVWLRELESMTPEEAILGWRACRDSGDSYVPMLPQFIGRVRDALKARHAQGPHLKQRMDPELEAMHKAAAKRAVAELPPPDEERMKRLKHAEHPGKAAVAEMRRLIARSQ